MKYIVPAGVMIFRYGAEQFSNTWKLFETVRPAQYGTADVLALNDIKFQSPTNIPNPDAFTFFRLPPRAYPWLYIAVPNERIVL